MSAAECWLIDGWNVLHGLSAAREGPRRALLSPEALLSLLAGFAAQTGCRMLVIWDGHGPGGDPRLKTPVSKAVESVYSADQTADAVLERYLFEHKLEGAFVVVTDDVAMSRIARGSGARVFSVPRLQELMQEGEKARRERADSAQADSYGFNRPFDEKLKKKGWDS